MRKYISEKHSDLGVSEDLRGHKEASYVIGRLRSSFPSRAAKLVETSQPKIWSVKPSLRVHVRPVRYAK